MSMRVYLDQNILGLIDSGDLRISSEDPVDWVYSDEHFRELTRGDSHLAERLLRILERIRARKLSQKLTSDWTITDEAELQEFQDPRVLYARFLTTVDETPDTTDQFNTLQAFFLGNKDLIDPVDFATSLREGLETLLIDIPEEMINDRFPDGASTTISQLAFRLQEMLEMAKPSIEPIDKARRKLSDIQFSTIKTSGEAVIDQIWESIGGDLYPLSKDEFFGKRKFAFIDPEKGANPVFLGMIQCYSALNYVGYWPDRKLSKRSRIPGINSDATHVSFGAFCNAIVSADRAMCQKAAAVYEYFDCGTNVIRIIQSE